MNQGTTGIIKVPPPAKKDVYTIRILIGCGLLSMAAFLYWFIDADHMGFAPVFWLLTFALGFKLLKMVHEWYHYWSPSVPAPPTVTRTWKVDILTTACPGEPKDMIIRTLEAMVAIRYPHTNYLCDEGDDPELKSVCESLGVIHVTRTLKVDAKAGNINNALRQATGEICVVLDPDHVPIPEFLDRVLPYFEDNNVGFVQCVQAYGNQSESFIARGAAEQTYHFYGPMMMCMNTYGTTQAIGANCTFRRAALDSIGGHAAGLSEDMHTAMQLHAKGWRSVYIPEILSRGLVPATLSSYYKQQLKWARGTFELLFRTYPKLFRNFTWRQKLHYLTLPFYFLYGLVNLVDIAVPLIALCTATVPWEVDITRFGIYFVTMCIFSMIIRLFAQRWLLEKHECGFHLHGGILRTATWWIFLIGFIYTIFKIRVPYIPTPKEDDHSNCVRLCLPNIAIIVLCVILIPIGILYDYTPYSIAMASYSALTVGMLSVTVVISQQKFVRQLASSIARIPMIMGGASWLMNWGQKFQETAYHFLRNGTAMLIAAGSLLFVSYSVGDDERTSDGYPEKDLGGFYFGMEQPAASAGLVGEVPVSVISATISWNTPAEQVESTLRAIREKHAIPYLVWMPGEAVSTPHSVCNEIVSGNLKPLLTDYARTFRKFMDPVFITFRGREGQPIPSATATETWQYLYTFFNSTGMSNLTWVWTPENPEDTGYPGEKFTDWIGVPAIQHDATKPFSDLYEPYRRSFGKFQKPVLLTSFACAADPGHEAWIESTVRDIRKNYREINGLICHTEKGDPGVSILSRYLDDYYSRFASLGDYRPTASQRYHYASPFIAGGPGHFTMTLQGKPYYIKGVAYNTAHDWRDGNMPLTRRQVASDLAKIREMGANTIRRYGTGVYDRNVLNVAAESDLRVIFGFWFDPAVDYFADKKRVADYFEELEEKVEKYKDHPAILAWTVGNESWGLLKHRFAKPYLVSVRRAYAAMVEEMARKIHEIDPTRPVFSCIEHEEYQIPGELVAFREEAPSLDAIGVNSYYKEQIRHLNHLAWQFDSLRPYFVSEFGPEGYWDPKYNRTRGGSVLEQPESEKAAWYAFQWDNYVEGKAGYNIGGVAYCWHDRMEGSLTWFGLSDYRGRAKPSYFALKNAWTGSGDQPMAEYTIQSPPVMKPGGTYTFSANCSQPAKNVRYEWMLLKDEYLDRIDNIEVHDDPRVVTVEIPESPSDYRLYLFAIGPDDKVVTASVPVKVSRSAR